MNYLNTAVKKDYEKDLSECHEPLFKMLQELSESGQETAEKMYGCNGWVLHIIQICGVLLGSLTELSGVCGLMVAHGCVSICGNIIYIPVI